MGRVPGRLEEGSLVLVRESLRGAHQAEGRPWPAGGPVPVDVDRARPGPQRMKYTHF